MSQRNDISPPFKDNVPKLDKNRLFAFKSGGPLGGPMGPMASNFLKILSPRLPKRRQFVFFPFEMTDLDKMKQDETKQDETDNKGHFLLPEEREMEAEITRSRRPRRKLRSKSTSQVEQEVFIKDTYQSYKDLDSWPQQTRVSTSSPSGTRARAWTSVAPTDHKHNGTSNKTSPNMLDKPNGSPMSLPGHKQQSEKGFSSSAELFDLLDRLQSAGVDDQRCSMPNPANLNKPKTRKPEAMSILQETLSKGPPYPMIVVPKKGGYWVDPPDQDQESGCNYQAAAPNVDFKVKFEMDETARSYRAHFLGYEHFNFHGVDENLGPVVVSLKTYNDQEKEKGQENHTRIIVRLNSGSIHKLIPESSLEDGLSPVKVAQNVISELTLEKLNPVLCPRASELIVNYDEHVLDNHYKFGLVYQREGQVTEEDIFANKSHSPAFDEFMEIIGQRIKLTNHQGYRGGLDTQYGQTGEESLYEEFHGREIMFHVSTFLPYTENDQQQLQKKRHIGNDIVAIVFQESNTPFTPDMITSHFLHAYIVVQPVNPCSENTVYKVSVAARSDVPYFGPSIPSPAVLKKGQELKDFLLNKLINAQNACLKAEEFSKLEQRTRTTLLAHLEEELSSKTLDFVGGNIVSEVVPPVVDNQRRSSTILQTFKKAIGGKTKSNLPTAASMDGFPNQSVNPQPQSHPRIAKSKSQTSYMGKSTYSENQQNHQRITPTRSFGRSNNPYQTNQRSLAGKSDSGRGSVGTGSTGRGSNSPTTGSPISSPDMDNGIGHPSGEGGDKGGGCNLSESDDSSLNSMEMDSEAGKRFQVLNSMPFKRTSVPNIGSSSYNYNTNSASSVTLVNGFNPLGGRGIQYDPDCKNVISGAVTMIPVDGFPPSGQLDRLQEEISRLKVDKLELLRQNVSSQREVKRLRERELQLQADLTTASREIHRLRVNMKENNNNNRKT